MVLRGVILLCALYVLVCGASTDDLINSKLNIKNAVRTIDLTTQLTKVSSKISLENNDIRLVKSFLFSVEVDAKDHVAYFHVQTDDSSKTPLKFVETEIQSYPDKPFWRIYFKDALQPGKTVEVDVQIIFSHQLVAHPATITQNEKQLVLYYGNHYLYSPYTVTEQSTTVNLGTRIIESYTELAPVERTYSSLYYGPYKKVSPFTVDKMTIHYENNAPFLTVTSLERVIEVSHWGNIAVEEEIYLEHTGAVLKGPFSRFEYQDSQGDLPSIKSFKTVLPAAASNVYYRDVIGNISTSKMQVLSDSVELDLRPRFPLFGGWKTNYILGYNLPSYEYLYNSRDEYLLKMRFLDHIYEDMIVDQVTIKIILPEGSRDIQLITPYPAERLPDSLHSTYLDTKGRPVVTLCKKNLVENHIQDFELQYTFQRVLMLQEPLLLVVAFFLLFQFAIVYVRLDFSITKDKVKESAMRVAGHFEKLLSHQYKRALAYQHYDDQLFKLKTTRNVNTFLASVKVINQELKNETALIGELLIKLKADKPQLAEKLSELQIVDKQLKELYARQQSLYLDKLIPEKINRQAFVNMENQIIKKKEEYVEKINALVKTRQ